MPETMLLRQLLLPEMKFLNSWQKPGTKTLRVFCAQVFRAPAGMARGCTGILLASPGDMTLPGWRGSLILVLAAMSAGACGPMPVVGARIDATRLHAGTYRGSAKHLDRAVVTIEVADRRVIDVRLDEFAATAHGQPARDVIPKRIVDLQSTKVDAVSGATEASNVIMNAVEAAVQRSYAGLRAPNSQQP